MLNVPARWSLALVASVLVGAAMVTTSSGADARSDCRTRGKTLRASNEARVYSIYRGETEIWLCSYSAKSVRQHVSLGLRSSDTRSIILRGRFAAVPNTRVGCARLGCEASIVTVSDARRRKRRTMRGEAFELRDDGVFATITNQTAGEAQSTAVRVWDRAGQRIASQGSAINGRSLALGPEAVYWTDADGPQAASAPGPIR